MSHTCNPYQCFCYSVSMYICHYILLISLISYMKKQHYQWLSRERERDACRTFQGLRIYYTFYWSYCSRFLVAGGQFGLPKRQRLPWLVTACLLAALVCTLWMMRFGRACKGGGCEKACLQPGKYFGERLEARIKPRDAKQRILCRVSVMDDSQLQE